MDDLTEDKESIECAIDMFLEQGILPSPDVIEAYHAILVRASIYLTHQDEK